MPRAKTNMIVKRSPPAHGGKHLKPYQWKPGQSANPAGRPKGSRTRLAEHFLSDLMADWEVHGKASIEAMREKSPTDYCKVVAATLPKELNVKVSEFDDLNDEQLARQFAAVASQLARAGISFVEGDAAAPPTDQVN